MLMLHAASIETIALHCIVETIQAASTTNNETMQKQHPITRNTKPTRSHCVLRLPKHFILVCGAYFSHTLIYSDSANRTAYPIVSSFAQLLSRQIGCKILADPALSVVRVRVAIPAPC